MKRVLVTGASGLLGSNTAAELLQSGYDVRVLLRKSSRTTALDGLDVEYAYGDLADEESLQKAARGCQFVVHAAANTRQWGVDKADYQRDNVDAVNKICRVVLRYDIERFIFVSTANVYQPGNADNPGDETTAADPVHSSTHYISSKITAEQHLLEKVSREQLPAIIVNPTFMIGPRDAQPSSGRLLLYVLRNSVLFCPAGGKNFVDVRDVACGIASAFRWGRVGQRYLLANENLSYADFFNKITAITGLRRWQFDLPALVLQGVARSCETWSKWSGRQLPLSSSGARLLNRHCYYSAQKAVRELHLPQTPIENAITAALEWFAHFGYWPESAYSPLKKLRP